MRGLKTRLLDMFASSPAGARKPLIEQDTTASLSLAVQLNNCLAQEAQLRSLIAELQNAATSEQSLCGSDGEGPCPDLFPCASDCQRPLPVDMSAAVKYKYK